MSRVDQIRMLIRQAIRREQNTRKIVVNLSGRLRTPQLTIECILVNMQMQGEIIGEGDKELFYYPKYRLSER